MKIAYVTIYDSADMHAWSSSGYHILRALQDVGFQTESIGNLRVRKIRLWLAKFKRAYYTKVLSRKYLWDREPNILLDYSNQVAKRLASMDYDIVFSPGTIPIAYLQTEKPIVFWTDATFAGMVDFYPDFTNLCTESIKNGNKMEKLALSKSCIAIYTSEWAANTAIQNYDVDPAKVKVVQFGANVRSNRNLNEISRIVENKNFDKCKLLFLGVDWYRKGGEMALTVADLLNQRGVRTELHVAGCNPSVRLPKFVKHHGLISKKTEEGTKHLDQLFLEAHFLILPSLADCVPNVFAEASSFGLPSLTTKVGGISTAIKDGKNGQTFSVDEDPGKYCAYIERLMSSKQEYKELALSSFREYSTKLNWLSAGSRVYDLMRKFCG